MAKAKRVVNVKKVVKEKQTEKFNNNIPAGVQVISVLYYISAVLCVLLGLLLVIGANTIVSFLVSSAPELESIITGGVIIAMGIIFIAVSVLAFFVGRGLWKLKPWARILAIILAAIWLIYTVYAMIRSFAFMQIINIIINLVVGGYLLFGEEVKEAFR